jgi:hypothetical protein
MKTVLITIAATVLTTAMLLAAITLYYVTSSPRTYTCQKI